MSRKFVPTDGRAEESDDDDVQPTSLEHFVEPQTIVPAEAKKMSIKGLFRQGNEEDTC